MAKTVEQTRSGHLFNPVVDIFESHTAITLLADLPGVKPEDLSVDLKEDILTISACITPSEKKNETELLREYEEGSYYRFSAFIQISCHPFRK